MLTSVARGIAGAGSLLATSFAFAQYVPTPGVRNSLLWIILAPWFVIFAGGVWSLIRKAQPYRFHVLRSLAWSVGGLASVVALLFAILGITDGLLHEEVAAVILYLLLFSGPLALVCAIAGLVASRLFNLRSQTHLP